jgi:RimJ/RimL family protein N-acetyltransferase
VTALRPVNRPDFPTFYNWRSQLAVTPTWTTAFRRIVRFEEFVNEMGAWLRDSVTMMAVKLETGEAVGFARAYHLNLVDGWAYVQGFADEAHRLSLHTAEATAMFGSYLFRQFPLRKIYSEVFGFNESVLRLNRKLGFRDCGKLRDHLWYGDRYWDLLQFELFREDWDEGVRRLGFLAGIEQEAAAQITSDGR